MRWRCYSRSPGGHTLEGRTTSRLCSSFVTLRVQVRNNHVIFSSNLIPYNHYSTTTIQSTQLLRTWTLGVNVYQRINSSTWGVRTIGDPCFAFSDTDYTLLGSIWGFPKLGLPVWGSHMKTYIGVHIWAPLFIETTRLGPPFMEPTWGFLKHQRPTA